MNLLHINILLHKLKHYGITGKANALFKSYLTECDQFVFFNKTKSYLISIYTVISQGSVLGPLLCSIYINDLPKSSSLFNVLMYGDDTTLYWDINQIPIDDRSFLLDNELNRIHEWLACNKLS